MLATVALLLLSQSSEPVWDAAFALALREQLAQRPLPGLVRLEHRPGRDGFRPGWTVELTAPNQRLTCSREKNAAFACRGPGLSTEAMAGLTSLVEQWLGRLEVPSTRWVELTIEELSGQPIAMLLQREGTQQSLRVLEAVEVWRLSGPIALAADRSYERVDLSVLPVPVPGGRLVVLRYDDGGNGNNASGVVELRGLILSDTDDPARLEVGDSVDLGKGGWGRAVGDDGFHMSSSANLLCAKPWPAGFELYEACPASVDPRSWATYRQWCEKPCAHGKLSARTGRYLVREGKVAKARGTLIRAPAPGELQLVEVPEPASSGFDWAELRNRSSAVLDLRDLTLANTYDGAPTSSSELKSEPSCFIDADETVWLAPRGADEHVPPGHQCELLGLSGPDVNQPIDLYRLARDRGRDQLLSRFVTHFNADEPWSGDRPRRSWQLDSHGKACLADSTPGAPNSNCR